MNGYRVHLTRVAGGFSRTVTKGQDPDPAETVVVGDDFEFSWSFTDEFAPNSMEPSTIGFSIVARSASDLPTLDPGDLWIVTVDLVDVTDDVVTVLAVDALEFVGRLGEPEVELVPTHSWSVRVRLSLSDLTADLRSRFPQSGPWENASAKSYATDWLGEWAERRARVNLWYPTKYATDSQLGFFLDGRELPDMNAWNQLTRLAASWPDKAGHLATLRWRYSTTPPDPTAYTGAGWALYPGEPGYMPDPSNPVGYVLQYVDRSLPDDALLPYRLTRATSVAPITTVLAAEPADSDGVAILSAAHVIVPATARRSRDQQPNTVILNGTQRIWKAEDTPGEYSWEYADTTMVITTDADRPRSKSFDTLSWLRTLDPDNIDFPDLHDNELTRARLERAYLPDEAALLDEWVYDRITVDTSQMTTTEFATVVPMLVSQSPDQADAVALRQVLVVDVDEDVDLSGRGRIAGRLVAGTVRISGGRMTYELQLAPGVLEPGASGITAAQLAAGPYSAAPATAFGDLTALDMRLVRA